MTMAYLIGELERANNPVDAAYAKAVGAMLLARGGDIPLPSDNPVGPDEADLVSEDNVIELFKPGLSVYESTRDGLLARFHATQELAMFPATEVTVKEEFIAESERARLTAETAAHDFVVAVMNKLVPKNHLARTEGYSAQTGILAADVADVKRLQSSVYFAYAGMPVNSEDNPRRMGLSNSARGSREGGSYRVSPHVVIGARDVRVGEWHAAEIMSFDLDSRQIRFDVVNADDYVAFSRLAQSHTQSEVKESAIRGMMQNDGRLFVTAYNSDCPVATYWSAGCDPNGWLERSITRRVMSRPSDIDQSGIRFFALHVQPQIAREFARGRLTEAVLDRYEIPKHLADVISALAPAPPSK